MDNHLEEFYNRRLERILRLHTTILLDDVKVDGNFKKNHLDKIERMLQIARENKIYSEEEMKEIEKEEMGYGREF